MAARDITNFAAGVVPLNIVKGSVAVDGRGLVAPLPQAEVLQRRWIPDERDAFIAWLRGEFAAANAIIDAMCQHLQMTGKTGEYDFVLACIQQRRYNWTAVLHMQQYFSVAEVVFALQQVALKKQQENASENLLPKQPHLGSVAGDIRSSNRAGQNNNSISKDERQDLMNSGLNTPIVSMAAGENPQRKESPEDAGNEGIMRAGERKEGKKPTAAAATKDTSVSRSSNKEARTRQMSVNHNVEHFRVTENGLPSASDVPLPEVKANIEENAQGDIQAAPSYNLAECGDKELKDCPREEDVQKIGASKVSRNLCSFVEIGGKMINVLEGLEFYEGVIDKDEAAKLVTLSQFKGRTGSDRGHAFISSRSLTKGKEKESIQFGTVPSEVLEDSKNLPFILKEESADPMPGDLESVIDHLIRLKIFPASRRPDSCIIQALEEGHRALPSHHHNFQEPFCILPVLSDCSLSLPNFKPKTSLDDPKRSFNFSLSVGSALILQGKSADLAKHAVISSSSRQVFLIFGKMLDKPKHTEVENSTSPDVATVSGSTKLAETIARSDLKHIPLSAQGPSFRGNHSNIIRVKNVSPVPGVVPILPTKSPGQVSAPGGPAVFPASNGNAVAYSTVAVVTPGWSNVPGVRLASAGTGVFLPFSGGSSTTSQTINGTQRRQGIGSPVPSVQNMIHPTASVSSVNGSAGSLTTITSSKPSTPVAGYEQDCVQST